MKAGIVSESLEAPNFVNDNTSVTKSMAFNKGYARAVAFEEDPHLMNSKSAQNERNNLIGISSRDYSLPQPGMTSESYSLSPSPD